MGKSKKKKGKKATSPKLNIQQLKDARDGGQIALRGYSYQFLYSCYLILSTTSSDISFQFEGVEDIDCIKQKESVSDVTHIQLKYSTNRQDASFFNDVLRNFLEAYLLDQKRFFKLVYDFPVAKGNLSKLVECNLDEKSYTYWSNVILSIKHDNPSWNWTTYSFDQFLLCLSFEKIDKTTLETEIEKSLIEAHDVHTDNVSIFANSIKFLCFDKMLQRAYVTKDEIDDCIKSVKIDISKGPQNPAHSWIRKLDYSLSGVNKDHGFYEGKKVTTEDIVNELPIKRPVLEQEIIDSIQKNVVTVIKASSGQGKTTLAFQVAYALQKEYKPYQLLWCNERQELGNIVQFFKARIQLGEKPLIVIDNLDNHFGKWNDFAQLMQSEALQHYKLIITSRESDWYNYSGDLSNIRSMNIIKPILGEVEAKEIFNIFRGANQLHTSITNWQKAWSKISGRQLLIEYVYLLTHGEMLSERIASQISEIGMSPSGQVKCDILRKVCFADVCGVRLPIVSLFAHQTNDSGSDYSELIKSMESEFLVHVNIGGYIEGLHPVRSKHIIDRLHEFLPIKHTALSVIDIAQKDDLSELFSHIPEFDLGQSEFFRNAVEKLWDDHDLSKYILAIQGLYSGSVMSYYRVNQSAFDDANSHSGLCFISAETCPFTKNEEFGVSLDTLDRMREIFPENKNIDYLCDLLSHIPACNLHETFVYKFCECLYWKLARLNFSEVNDMTSYAAISEWIYNIDSSFNLSVKFSFDYIWQKANNLSLECISTLMYVSYCGNKENYTRFVEKNLNHILTYLKQKTKSHKLYINAAENAIHVEYILREDIQSGNEESVARLKCICKTLPVFDIYCADALKPKLNLLSAYPVPDDAHKEMPIRNIAMMFRQSLASLWNKTIMSNYEFDTVAEWLNHWCDLRKHICLLADKFCACIYRLLSEKSLASLAGEVNQLRKEFVQININEKRYPREDRPFKEKSKVPNGLAELKNEYFQCMQNFSNQFVEFLSNNEQKQNLAMVNLTTAQSSLSKMQNYFADVAINSDFQDRHLALCSIEIHSIEQLVECCAYYQAHSPSKYFDKYQIRDWYQAHCQAERKLVEDGLAQLRERYSIHFPNKVYGVKMLRYYPIIFENLDTTSEINLSEWFIGCLSFADAPFDYLVVLCLDSYGDISPTALQFPKQLFIDIKKSEESDDPSLLRELTPPYPVGVTSQMLECFGEKYDLPVENISESNAFPISEFAEDLWVYSMTSELLKESEDADYRTIELKNIQAEIVKRLCILKNKLLSDDIAWVTAVYENVINGSRFDDILFNEFIERFAQKIVEIKA